VPPAKDVVNEPIDANHPAALLVAAAAVLAAAAVQLRDKHRAAELTVENIHEQLDALVRSRGQR
jgi:hypothetical protein